MEVFNDKLIDLILDYGSYEGKFLVIDQIIAISKGLLTVKDPSFCNEGGEIFMGIAEKVYVSFLPPGIRNVVIELIGCWENWYTNFSEPRD